MSAPAVLPPSVEALKQAGPKGPPFARSRLFGIDKVMLESMNIEKKKHDEEEARTAKEARKREAEKRAKQAQKQQSRQRK